MRDTGPGVPEEFKPRLIGAIETMGRKDGPRLGLCIAKEICVGHGGTIRLDDTGPSGACFVSRLRPASLAGRLVPGAQRWWTRLFAQAIRSKPLSIGVGE
ncbi:MAG: hypothetical protein HYZ53_07905 [Planctomycetes bacterium]|nr:hypothetical protein [Planctomycetota bacterium]